MMKTTKQWGLCLVLVFLVLSCNKPQVFNAAPLGAPGTVAPPIEEEYKINIGDKLSIKLFYNPELNQEVVVRPDGRITLQLVNEVKVLKMTPARLSEVLTEGYAKYLAQPPEISVIVNSFAGQKVFVGGEVGKPGVTELSGPTTVLGAITAAGSFKESADRNQVILVRKDDNDKPIYMNLNIEKAMKGIDPSQDVYLQAYDIVVVPRSGIADVDLWIDQYIGHTLSYFSPFAYAFIGR
jgi:protein involved in polysaccharide export with SLBB domain